MTTAVSTMIAIRDKGFHSMKELESEIKRLSSRANLLRKEFRDKEFELKRIKEITKQLQICINKKAHYDGYRKNPNDKIYMMMSRKDVEVYQKSYEEIDIFLKQFPHLRHVVVGELKTKSSKNLFRKLNEHSKELQAKQEEIIKKHNSLAAQYDELENLKTNMNDYLGRDKMEKKKDSVICSIKDHQAEEKENHNRKNKISKEAER